MPARTITVVKFRRYNPPLRQLTPARRNGHVALDWVRLQTDWYGDKDIGTMPEDLRWMWPALLALAGKGRPPGRVRMTDDEIAFEWRTSAERVAAAIDHLRRTGRIAVRDERDESVTRA